MKSGRREWHIICIYCESTHELQGNPAYGRKCSKCGKLNHFEWVCRSQRRQVSKDHNRKRSIHNMHQVDGDKEVAILPYHQISNNCNVENKMQSKADTCK